MMLSHLRNQLVVRHMHALHTVQYRKELVCVIDCLLNLQL